MLFKLTLCDTSVFFCDDLLVVASSLFHLIVMVREVQFFLCQLVYISISSK